MASCIRDDELFDPVQAGSLGVGAVVHDRANGAEFVESLLGSTRR